LNVRVGQDSTRSPAPGAEIPVFQDVYARHAAFVWRTLRRLGVREADVEDVAQETFVVVHRKLSEFNGLSSIKTWVFGICIKMASDYRRRAHIRKEEAVAEVPDTHLAPPQPEAIARTQARALLDRALDELDDDKRATFVLFELEQLPMQEVADTTGVPLQTAYARLYAARKIIESFVRGLHNRGVSAT